MNAIDAAAKVLAEAGKPLSYREITRALCWKPVCGKPKAKRRRATIHDVAGR